MHLPIGTADGGCLLDTARIGACVFTLKLYINGAELGRLVGILIVPEIRQYSIINFSDYKCQHHKL